MFPSRERTCLLRFFNRPWDPTLCISLVGGLPFVDEVRWIEKALKAEIEGTLKKTHIMVPGHRPETEWIKYVMEHQEVKGIFLVRDPRDLLVSYLKATQSGIWPEGQLERE